MEFFKRIILPILLATIWISISEFVRNELLLKSNWINHYKSLGLIFPSETLNGVVWGLWSLLFAIAIYMISKKFSLLKTTFSFLVCWICANVGSDLEYECIATWSTLYCRTAKLI